MVRRTTVWRRRRRIPLSPLKRRGAVKRPLMWYAGLALAIILAAWMLTGIVMKILPS